MEISLKAAGEGEIYQLKEKSLVDFHLHTKFSDDSIMELDDLVETALANNIKMICITDHLEPDEFEFSDRKAGETQKKLKQKIASYFEEISKKTRDWEKREDIKIFTGIELGLSLATLAKSKEIIKSYPFDFVLASLHCLEGIEVNNSSLYEQNEENELIKNYFQKLYKCLKEFNEYDSLAHLDLIRRYIKRYKGKDEVILNYNNEINFLVDEILKLLRDRGKGLEINSSGYRYGLFTPMPSYEVIKRYRELGGELVTIGSDAHTTSQVGEKLQNLKELLLEAGFEYIFVYKKRKALPVKIKKFY